MRKLKTPEEIYKEFQHCRELQKSEAIEMIKAAQRDALECAVEKIDDEVKQTMNSYCISILNFAKKNILNLMPEL